MDPKAALERIEKKAQEGEYEEDEEDALDEEEDDENRQRQQPSVNDPKLW